MSREDCSSLSAFLDGMPIPRPPSLAVSANREHSRSLGEGLPVNAGRSLDRKVSSICIIRQLILGGGTTQIGPLTN